MRIYLLRRGADDLPLRCLVLQYPALLISGSFDGLSRLGLGERFKARGRKIPGPRDPLKPVPDPPYEGVPPLTRVGGLLEFSDVWKEVNQDKWVISTVFQGYKMEFWGLSPSQFLRSNVPIDPVKKKYFLQAIDHLRS